MLLSKSGIICHNVHSINPLGIFSKKDMSMKLNAFIAHAGICSRRKAADLVKEGSVKVNGVVVRDPSYDVQEGDHIKVKGRMLKAEKKVYIMLNKPAGYVATVADERGRPTVLDLIGKKVRERVFPVGRLDRGTTGLLLLTNDGDFAYKLTHPRFKVAKTYRVTLDKDLAEKDVMRIKKGVYLPDGKVMVDAVSVLPRTNRVVRIVLHSGKKRVVRRLFEKLGYTVKSLDRIAYAGLTLRDLPRGRWRMLSSQEVKRLSGVGSSGAK